MSWEKVGTVRTKDEWVQSGDFTSSNSSTTGNMTFGIASKYVNEGHKQTFVELEGGDQGLDCNRTLLCGKGGRLKSKEGVI